MEKKNETNALSNAFPFAEPLNEHEIGLTKREYFAAMAMQGLCATDMLRSRELHKQLGDENLATKAIAIADVEIADALITSLNKPAE